MKKTPLLITLGIMVLMIFAVSSAVIKSKVINEQRATAYLAEKAEQSEKLSQEKMDVNAQTITGTLLAYHADDLEKHKTWQEYTLVVSEKESYQIKAEKIESLNLQSGSTISITGNISNNIIETKNENIKVIKTSALEKTKTEKTKALARTKNGSANTGGKKEIKIAVILFNFTDNQTEAYNPTVTQDVIYGNTPLFSTNNYYQDISGNNIKLVGKINPAGDIYGYYTIPTNQTNACDPYMWGYYANQMATADGFDPAGYDIVAYNFPQGVNSCGWSGAAIDGSPLPNTASFAQKVFIHGTWIPTYIHEIGHALGLNHANSLSCLDKNGNPTSISTNCISNEYGDPFDTMGATNWLYFNIRNNDYLGFITQNRLKEITTSGNYNLRSGNIPPTGQRYAAGAYGLKIPIGNLSSIGGQMYYYIESRNNTGWDAGILNTAQTGITIRLGINGTLSNNQNLSRSNLIDTHPNTTTFADAPLQAGEVFIDNDRGIKISFEQFSDYKMVNVTYLKGAVNCTINNPKLSVLPFGKNVAVGAVADFDYSVKNTDTGQNCPPRIFANSLIDLNNNFGGVMSGTIGTPLVLSAGVDEKGKIIVATSAISPSHYVNYKQFIVKDFFSEIAKNFTLEVGQPDPCVGNSASFPYPASTQTGTAQQLISFPFRLFNNNSATCTSRHTFQLTLQTPTLNGALSPGWTISYTDQNSQTFNSSTISIPLSTGQTSPEFTYNVQPPAGIALGDYKFNILVTDTYLGSSTYEIDYFTYRLQ